MKSDRKRLIEECNKLVISYISPLIILAAGMILWGCAASPPKTSPVAPPAPPKKAEWQCSQTADQAMEEGDIETGLREHARYVVEHPNNPLAHYHLGYAFGQMGDIEHEIAHYEAAISLGYLHNGQLFFNLGMAYSEIAQYPKAIESFNKALKIEPESIDALIELSRIYHEIGDVHNERTILKRHLELEPNDESVQQRLEALP